MREYIIAGHLFTEFEHIVETLTSYSVNSYEYLECFKKLVEFLTYLSEKIAENVCDLHYFRRKLLNFMNKTDISFEIKWVLNYLDILTYKDYLSSLQDDQVVNEVQNLIVLKGRAPDNSRLEKTAVDDLACLFLQNLFDDYHTIITPLVNILLKDWDQSLLKFILESVQFSKHKIKFCYSMLDHLCFRNKPVDVIDVTYSITEDKTNNNSNEIEFCKILLTHMPFQDVKLYLDNIFHSNKYINSDLDVIIALIKTYCELFEGSFAHIKNIIAILLQKAFREEDKLSLAFSFLFGRICCKLNSKIFSTYISWFSSNFSSDSPRPISTLNKAVFFMSFLSDIVFLEKAVYLRAHITRVPYLPSNCQYLLADYIDLAKVRLSEMNEPVEMGLFESSSVKEDVDYVLSHFERTNEINQSLLEAALFRKKFYEKQFLPELLSVKEDESSIRFRFVQLLFSMNKIPIILYQQFMKFYNKS